MIKSLQHETIRQQCRSFESIGWKAKLTTTDNNKLCPHVVHLYKKAEKLYCLADPDLNVIIMQLAKLYQGAKIAINNVGTGRA